MEITMEIMNVFLLFKFLCVCAIAGTLVYNSVQDWKPKPSAD